MIFGKFSVLREVEWQELDISGTGRLYRFIPLKMFGTLERLNMSSTMITFSTDSTGGDEFGKSKYL